MDVISSAAIYRRMGRRTPLQVPRLAVPWYRIPVHRGEAPAFRCLAMPPLSHVWKGAAHSRVYWPQMRARGQSVSGLCGWMAGWIMAGWIYGWIDGQIDGWMDGQIDGWMDGQIDGWMD